MAQRLQRNAVEGGIDQLIDFVRRTHLAQARELFLQLCSGQTATHRQIEIGTVRFTQACIAEVDLPATGTCFLQRQGNDPRRQAGF
ncbi:hypothetical protein D3C86_1712200 [compost metagenome]